MKSITSFLAIVTLSLVTSAFAQEESPAPTEEKPSANVEETPSATTTEEAPMVTPAPEKSAAPMPAKAASPATETKKASAATKSASPSASSSSAMKSSTKMSPEASVKDMENRWEAAVMTHDASAIQGYIASDFMGVYKGKFTNKSSALSEFKSDKDTYKSAKNERLNVKMYGSNVVVVTGRAREKGMGKDGKAFDHSYLFTDTWMGRGGQWQCIASQVTELK